MQRPKTMETVGIRRLISWSTSKPNKQARLQGKDTHLARQLRVFRVDQVAVVTDEKYLPDG